MRVFWLILSWLAVGVVATAAGFLGFLYPITAVVLLLPCAAITHYLVGAYPAIRAHSLGRLELFISVLIIVVWLSHAVQVLTPETGFDAVWYHLPVAAADTRAHRFVYLRDLYQSVNPLFSDATLFLGFMVAGELGAKCVAYLFGLTLLLLAYSTARVLLPRVWSLILALTISTFQVVAWQSASFYVDVAKAAWELMAIWCVLYASVYREQLRQSFFSTDHVLMLSALALGGSLATKQFSLLLLPVFCVLWWLSSAEKNLFAKCVLVTKLSVIALMVLAPFLLFSLKHTGIPWYGVSTHLQNLQPIAAQASLNDLLRQRATMIWQSPAAMLLARDYTSPLLVMLLPILIWAAWKRRLQRGVSLMLAIFAVGQWLIWWFVPPLSTRYALGGFVALGVLELFHLVALAEEKKWPQRPILIALTAVAVLFFIPRLMVNMRSMRYVLGLQSKQAYLDQFRDGWIDELFDRWHGKRPTF